MQDRERFAPVALAAEQPVAQFELHLAAADVFRFEPFGDDALGLRRGQTVEGDFIIGASDVDAVAAVRLVAKVNVHVIGRFDHLRDRQIERACKVVVALIVGRHGHDRARAVAHQHVVGDPDGNRLAGGGIDREGPGVHAGLGVRFGHAIDIAA